MSTISRTFQKRKSDARRQSLIDATLEVIARDGVAAATVRTISREAQVTQGLIRYYFQSKEDLIIAAYEAHMIKMLQLAEDATQGAGTAKCRLIRYIKATLEPPVATSHQVGTWAGFLQILLHRDDMLVQHTKCYEELRLQTKRLISDVFIEAGISKSDAELRRLSIATVALLDGLWIEGGAIGDNFQQGELLQVSLESLSALINVDLSHHYENRIAVNEKT